MNPNEHTEQLPDREIESVRLTDWENEPSIGDLKQELSDAKLETDTHVGQVNGWLDTLHTRGKSAVKSPKGRSSIVPKVVRKQAEWRYAPLSEPFLSTADVFNISPVTFEDKEAAKQNELVLNNQFNTKINKVSFFDEYVRTAVDEGTVIVRVGWDFQEELREVEVPVYNDIPVISEGAVYPAQQVQTGTQLIEKLVTVKNAPTLEVCDYRNTIIDPSCNGDVDKAQFVIHSFETSVSELKKEGDRYKNLSSIRLDSSSILADPDHDTRDNQTFNFNDDARKRIIAYEYWGFYDIRGNGNLVPIVATWIGNTLIRMEESPFPDKKLPFIVVQYLPVRKSNYGEPDGALLEDNQMVIGAVTRGMLDTMGRSANGQTGIRKDMLDVSNRRKFERGEDYEFNATTDPRQGVFMHTYPEIPSSAQFMLQTQNMEAESLTGVKAFSTTGITGNALGETTGNGRSVLDAASKRETGILRRLAQGVIQIGRKFISMNAEFLSEQEIIRVTNEEFVAVRRDDLAGEFDLRLTISTAEEDNAKAQELAFMLQTLGPNEDPGMRKIILSDIARLRKMPDLAKRIEEYEPQPDPLEVQRKQLEIQLLQAQLQKTISEAEENAANAELYRAKVGNINSDTDNKELDYLEQESGTRQERDLQKQGAQARANMELELLKNELGKQQKADP